MLDRRGSRVADPSLHLRETARDRRPGIPGPIAAPRGAAMGPGIAGPRTGSRPGADQGRGRVGATCTMAVSRGDLGALLCAGSTPPSRDCHRADMVPIRREEETSVVSHRTGRVESSR